MNKTCFSAIISAVGLFCCDKFEETPNEKVTNMSKLAKPYFSGYWLYLVLPSLSSELLPPDLTLFEGTFLVNLRHNPESEIFCKRFASSRVTGWIPFISSITSPSLRPASSALLPGFTCNKFFEKLKFLNLKFDEHLMKYRHAFFHENVILKMQCRIAGFAYLQF